MFGLNATLTGRVLRALAAAGVIGAAACQDADRAVGPTKQVGGPSAIIFNPNPPDPTEQPDLAVQSMTYAPANPLVGLPIQFTAVVRNIGSVASGATTLNFQIAAEVQDAQTWVNVPALDPGQEYTVQRPATHLSAGSYVARATVADPGANHVNDSKSVSYTVVQGTAQADLIVKRLTHSPDYAIDAYNFRLTAVVANLGLTTAGASILSFSGWAPLSLSPFRPAQPIYFSPCSLPLGTGQVWVPALAPGQEYTVQWDVQLQLGPGQYQIVATANSPQCTTEANMSNNSATDQIWVYHEII
jgi:hypothetical protein